MGISITTMAVKQHLTVLNQEDGLSITTLYNLVPIMLLKLVQCLFQRETTELSRHHIIEPSS